MRRKYLAFDIETAKVLPAGTDDLKAQRPLGIACAAMRAEDDDEPHLWYSCDLHGTPSPKMARNDLAELVSCLAEHVAQGYTIVTWNGVGFDFDILAEESERYQECRDLALNHVDIMFLVLCVKGFVVSLEAASAGISGQSEPIGISGAKVPQLWADGETKKVLAYVANDCALTLQIAKACERRKRFSWVTRRGSSSHFLLPNERLLTVAEANRLPEPDTSWMTEAAWPRPRFTDWLAIESPVSEDQSQVYEAEVVSNANDCARNNLDRDPREIRFDFVLTGADTGELPIVGDPVFFWAPPDKPDTVFIYRRGSVGGGGKLGFAPSTFARQIAHHKAAGLPFDTEITGLSGSTCSIRCRLISAEEVAAEQAEKQEKLQAELEKPYRPRNPVTFSIDAKSIVLEMGQILTFESIPSAAECAADPYGSAIVLRVEDGRTITKVDEVTMKKKLVRLSHTYDSMAAKVVGEVSNIEGKRCDDSGYKVRVISD